MNLTKQTLTTPAFIFDEETLLHRARRLSELSHASGARLLFALKSLAYASVLEVLKPHVDGFACSSLFEATIAGEVANDRHSIHLTTPGLRSDEIEELASRCDYISFNSLPQWQRFREEAVRSASCGLRINPQLSLVKDDRYNPCRAGSKLGVPLDQLAAALQDEPAIAKDIRGIHFHNNCDATEFTPLLDTVRQVESRLRGLLDGLEWVNLGGGYLFHETAELAPFHEAVERLRSRYGVQVFVEPGAALVREGGRLVASVVDLFRNAGRMIAVLDTTVNHVPELFEYQCEPEVVGAVKDGRHSYTLAGSSCLAGDLFGEHTFDEPLEVGSQVVFANVGAYALVKSHMFNGINLPTIYAARSTGDLVVQRRFTYDDFARRNGVENHVLV